MVRFKKNIFAIFLCIVFIASCLSSVAMACTAIMVGKNASATGAVIISRNEDYSVSDWPKYLIIHPAKTANAGEVLVFGHGLKVPAPRHSLRYTAMPDWNSTADTGDGPFEQYGVNSANVAISATVSTTTTTAVERIDPFVKEGIVESVIPSLLLPQATRAKEAVLLLGNYIDQYGAGESNGILIADPQEAWLFEVASAKHWIAVRVPDDAYMVHANRLRINDVNLDDTENVIASKGLYEFVVNNKLLDQPDRQHFNFAEAFDYPNDTHPAYANGKSPHFQNVDREWFGMHVLSPSQILEPRQTDYPLFMRPDKPITVQDIASILRNPDYKGTPIADKYTRPIGTEKMLETHIVELRSDMPKELVALSWQSFASAKDSFLIPLYLNALDKIPPAYQRGTPQYDPSSAWWSYRLLTTLPNATKNRGVYREKIHAIRAEYEKAMFLKQKEKDDSLKILYTHEPLQAITEAGAYSYQMLEGTLEKVREINALVLRDLKKGSQAPSF